MQSQSLNVHVCLCLSLCVCVSLCVSVWAADPDGQGVPPERPVRGAGELSGPLPQGHGAPAAADPRHPHGRPARVPGGRVCAQHLRHGHHPRGERGPAPFYQLSRHDTITVFSLTTRIG